MIDRLYCESVIHDISKHRALICSRVSRDSRIDISDDRPLLEIGFFVSNAALMLVITVL